MIRRHHWALAVPALLAIAVLASVAAAAIVSQSVGITGSGTVVVTGRVVIFGTINGPAPVVDVATTGSRATITAREPHRTQSWTIAKRTQLQIQLPSGQTSMWIPYTATDIHVRLHGAKIALTVAGRATITFSGTGTYASNVGAKGKKWPRTALELRN
jgi:hypothetical protein